MQAGQMAAWGPAALRAVCLFNNCHEQSMFSTGVKKPGGAYFTHWRFIRFERGLVTFLADRPGQGWWIRAGRESEPCIISLSFQLCGKNLSMKCRYDHCDA